MWPTLSIDSTRFFQHHLVWKLNNRSKLIWHSKSLQPFQSFYFRSSSWPSFPIAVTLYLNTLGLETVGFLEVSNGASIKFNGRHISFPLIRKVSLMNPSPRKDGSGLKYGGGGNALFLFSLILFILFYYFIIFFLSFLRFLSSLWRHRDCRQCCQIMTSQKYPCRKICFCIW